MTTMLITYIVIFLLVAFTIIPIILCFVMPSKGKIGEQRVSALLKNLPNNEYDVLNDILIPCEFGTTQIDHLVFSRYGIFIIETKNYKGWIYGNENAENWTQKIYRNKYYTFRNPVKQNYAHQKALQSILAIEDYCFHPIVVFADSAYIKNHIKETVVNNHYLISTILKYKDEVINSTDIPNLINKVKSAALIDKSSRKNHVKSIRYKVKADELKIKYGICPKCGASLVLKYGTYGKFYGCSNYPKCTYIHKA